MPAFTRVAVPILVGAVTLSCSAGSCSAGHPSGDSGEPVLTLPSQPAAAATRAAQIESIQRLASEAYAVDATAAAEVLTAANPAHRMRTRFGPDGIEVVGGPPGRNVRWGLQLAAYGRSGALEPVAPVAPSKADNEVRYVHPNGLEQWYVNGPLGLEQGFTIHQPPVGPAGEVQIDLAVTGELSPTLDRDRDRAELRRDDGTIAFAFAKLYATDATGRVIPTALAVRERRIRLRIDDTDATYPLRIDPLIWAEKEYFFGDDDGSGMMTLFGVAVAISGSSMAVGAPNENVGGLVSSGAIYLFERNADGAWSLAEKRPSPDPAVDQHFGQSAAMVGDTMIIGATGSAGGGEVYVYAKGEDGSWSHQTSLVGDDTSPGDRLGRSVALQGDTAVVGAALASAGMGAAYVFVRAANDSWSQQAKLVPTVPDPTVQLGLGVAVHGDTVVAGATGYPGRAYVFIRDGNDSWSQQAALSLNLADPTAESGAAVAINGNLAVVGAQDESGTMGAVFPFTRDENGAWTAQPKLMPDTVLPCDQSPDGCLEFGISTVLTDDRLLVGAPMANILTGAAYLYAHDGSGEMTLVHKFVPSLGAGFQAFGDAVALDGGDAACGADWARAAYVFRLAATDGDVCSDNIACHSGLCVDGVCCGTACNAQCDVCSEAAGAATDGTCAIAPAGTPCGSYACNGSEISCPTNCVTDTDCAPPAFCSEHGDCVPPCIGPADCEEDEYCAEGGKCVNQHQFGEVCDDGNQCASGHCVDELCCTAGCDPFRCRSDGVCRERCDSTAHCVDGHECDADGQCVPAAPVVVVGPGCLCRIRLGPPTDMGGWRWVLVLLALTAARARRRRSRNAPRGARAVSL